MVGSRKSPCRQFATAPSLNRPTSHLHRARAALSRLSERLGSTQHADFPTQRRKCPRCAISSRSWSVTRCSTRKFERAKARVQGRTQVTVPPARANHDRRAPRSRAAPGWLALAPAARGVPRAVRQPPALLPAPPRAAREPRPRPHAPPVERQPQARSHAPLRAVVGRDPAPPSVSPARQAIPVREYPDPCQPAGDTPAARAGRCTRA